MTLINPELPYDPSGYEASPLEGVGVIETDDPYIGQGFAPRVVRFGPEAEQMAFTVPVDDLPLIDTDTILTEDRLTQLEEEETIPSSVEDLLADYDRFTNGEKETFRFSVPFRDEEGTRVLCSFLGSLAARSDVLARKGTYKDLIKSSLAECLKSGEDGVSERRGVLGSHLSTLLFMRVEKRYVEDSDNPSLINFELVFVWEAERVHQWEARKADISWLEDADSQPIEQYFS